MGKNRAKLEEAPRRRFGSEFHVNGPATANAWLPYVIRQCGGTVSWWLAAERRCCRDAVSETGDQCTARYCGAVPSWHRHIIIHSLYLMRSGTSSQWRPACSSCIRPWSNFLVPLTTRAATFNSFQFYQWQTSEPRRRQHYSNLSGTSRKRAWVLWQTL